MICGTFATSGLTKEEADFQEQAYRSNDPAPDSVIQSLAADGTWTVTAAFPPCPANVTHDVSGASGTMAASNGRPPTDPPANGQEAAANGATPRGRYAVDSFNPVNVSSVAAASGIAGGGVPAFWGRYIYAPGRVNSSGKVDNGHFSAAENAVLRASNIRLLPICRQTSHVGQDAEAGKSDAARNVAALFEVFPPAYLSGADPDVLMFLDSECSPTQPTLSAEYYSGWAATIVAAGNSISGGRVNLHPALYASQSDTGTWSALRMAIQNGAPCDGVWVAAWNKIPAMVDWNDARTTPSGGLPCPILAWQYSDQGGGFDTNTTNPVHDDALLSRLVMPPP